jgi:DNA topoisomerase-3
MSKRLILAEKPSVGKEIARVLKCNNKKNGYIEGNDAIVTWAYGHLVTLGDPEIYGEKYKNWNLNDLPILPAKLKTKVIGKTSKQYSIVKKLMLRKDVNEIVIATDAGREGELVARWIIEKVNVKKSVKRLWISSVTDKAIREGFKKLRPGKDYENLFRAATARAESDWIVGINGTRALTTKHNAQLSLGRVQTPTLALISQREELIRNFKSRKFYGAKIKIFNVDADFKFKSKESMIFDESKIDTIVSEIKGKEAIVEKIITKNKKEYCKKLYDLTSLQRDAFNKYEYSPKMTLSIMQRLYESYKVLTYPRTDSNYLTRDIVPTLKDRLKTIQANPFRKVAFHLMKEKIRTSKNFVDDSKVSDHHAIIPTEEALRSIDLSIDERRIYELVVQRFLEVLMPPCEYQETIVTLSIGDYKFEAKYKNITSLGFKGIFEKEQVSKKTTKFIEKQNLRVADIRKTSGETKPPSYFNEASLLDAMENPSKYMHGEKNELKEILTETGGLGTVATRADIIEKLYQTKYMSKSGKNIKLTKKGNQVLKLVPKDLRSPLLTAEWEKNLREIEKGTLSKKEFIEKMRLYTKSIVAEIRSGTDIYQHDNLTSKKCPECGKSLMAVDNKYGKSLVCIDRECGYRENISKVTNARCPTCHKKLSLRGKKDNQMFTCTCGFRESMASFEKRKKERNSKGGKKDFANYMKKQNKDNKSDTNEDNPFAKALGNFKL